MEQILISIVVPVYNVESYIAKCLDSILEQNLDDCEIVLVNDGSTDNSLKICEKYQKKYSSKIKLISQKNKGLGGARNTGIKHSRGRFLWFIDSDDYLKPNSLSDIKSIMVKNNYPEILIFNMLMLSDDGVSMGRIADDFLREGVLDWSEKNKSLVCSSSACNKIFAKKLFTKNKISFPEKVWYEDLRTVPKLCFCAQNVARADYDAYVYIIRNHSIIHNKDQSRNLEIIDALEDLRLFFSQQEKTERYEYELNFLAMEHLLIHATVRLLKINSKSPELFKIVKYYDDNFIFSRNNPYFKTLSTREKIVYFLIKSRLYFILSVLLRIGVKHA